MLGLGEKVIWIKGNLDIKIDKDLEITYILNCVIY